MTPEPAVTNPAEETNSIELPAIGVLFSQGWQYAKSNVALIAMLSIPLMLVVILAYLAEGSTGQLRSVLDVVTGVVTLLAMVGYVLLMATALYLVTHQSQRPQFSDGFAWAKGHFWSVLWLSILTGLVVWGGFLLFIVPGIIVATYIALSQIVLATEGVIGMSALLRSRQLVYGNWWAVFGRMVGVYVRYFCALLVVGLVVVLIAAFAVPELYRDLFIDLVFVPLNTVGTLIVLSVTCQIYRVLKEHEPEITESSVPPASGKYQALTWFGLLSMVVFTVAAVHFAQQTPSKIFTTQQQQVLKAGLLAQLEQVQTQAQQYAAEQPQGSFAGVCGELPTEDLRYKPVVCTESDTAYALSVQLHDTTYCIDSTGYKKIIYTELGERTRCLAI